MEAKKTTGRIVIILAGDKHDDLDEQLSFRARVKNHFRTIRLPNYNEDQLCTIFHGMVRRQHNWKMKLEEDVFVKMLIRCLVRNTDQKTFSNIWELKKAFADADRRQVDRLHQARSKGQYVEDWLFTQDDLLGATTTIEPSQSTAWKDLQAMPGMDDVKESIVALGNQLKHNHQREIRGKRRLPITANRVFLGPPGTGKTTVANLYGKVLADFGLLSKGDVIRHTTSDLISQYVDHHGGDITEALDEAKGCVLIIDDFHMLDPGQKGPNSRNSEARHGIIDAIVAKVTETSSEDSCIILCGLPDQMREMYANCNPGLARKFALEDAFVFEDFDIDMLGKILDSKLADEGLLATVKAREVAIEILKRASVRPNFGNGGELTNLVVKAIAARSHRLMKQMSNQVDKMDILPIEPEDIDPEWERSLRAAANTRELFEGFAGYEDIIAKFEGYQHMVQGMRLRGIDPRPYVPFTYVFKGPPGTGKTTTARKMGHVFYDMGLIGSPDVIEASASELIGEYIGSTAPKTKRLLESALGKVLFIDEAYRLRSNNPRNFTDEAVSELVDAVTKPQFARKLIIILAGYDDDMDKLMGVNPGLKSRFATELIFRPMRAEQCLDNLRTVVDKVGITIQETSDMSVTTRNSLLGALEKMMSEAGWASGRSVETLGEEIIAQVFKECALNKYTGDKLIITGKDLIPIFARSGQGSAMEKTVGGQGRTIATQATTPKELKGSRWKIKGATSKFCSLLHLGKKARRSKLL